MLSFSLLATLLVGISVATIAPAQAVATCAEGGPCALGDTGPGGGKVFYVSSTTFTCGPAADLTCKYLEAAPKNWSGGISDPTAIYAANDYNPTALSTLPGNQLGSIGRGYSDSIWILAYNFEAPTVAAGIARAYLGGGKNDWYLPATAELNLLCQVARGVTQNVTTPCTGGTTSPDFSSGIYWATSGYESSKAWAQDFSTGVQSGQTKRNTLYVRPIRAFGGPAATAPGAATVTSTVVNNSKITVNFTAPTSNGNASILTYKYSTDGGATFSTRATGTTASPLVITTSSSDGSALVNETTYSVQIKAVNSVGDGPATTSTSAKVMYVLGDTGPGGGKVFYVSPTTFKCGSDWLSDCKYLEAAPKTWSGGTSDPTAIYTATDYDPTGRSGNPGLSLFGLGRGYRDSNNILARGEASSVAAGIARGYRGGGKNDWYLPHTAEINLLCQLARGVVQNVEIECSGGTNSADFNASNYWTTFSDDRMYLSGAWMQNFSNGIFSGGDKQTAYSVRPIRAFGGPAAKVAQATLTVNPATGTFGSTVTLVSAGGSGSGAVTYATTSTNCSISGSTLSVTAVATCAVVATKATDSSYNAATSASVNIVFAQALPSVTLQYPNSNTVAYSLGETLSATSFSRSGSGAITFSTASSACSIDSSTAVISILTAGICDAYVNVAEEGNYTARSAYTRVTITALTGLTATFDTTTATSDGFRVNLTNYSSDYSFTLTVDTGTVTAGIASGSMLPLVVSGLTPGESATVTVATNRVGYGNVSATVGTRSIANKTVTFKPNFTASPPSDTSQSSNSAINLLGNAFTRANFTFTGWNTEANGTGTPYANGASYGFASDVPLFAQWVQNSLYGITPSDLTLVGSLTAAGINSRFEGSTGGSTVAVQYETGSLPTGTVINIHLLASTARAASLITSTSSFILSFVVSWLAPDGTVPLTESGTALSMTISNSLIKKGASVYSVIGSTATRIGTATADGVVTIAITEDPEIVIAIGRPDAPTGVVARDGENSVSTVTWNAPAGNGGSSITSYLVTSSGGQSCSPGSLATLSCVVTGLSNGQSYTFIVTATNAAGISDSSTATAAIRPVAPVVSSTPVVTSAPVSVPTPAPVLPARVDPDPAIAAAAIALAQAKAEEAAAEVKAAEVKAAEVKAAEVKAAEEEKQKAEEEMRLDAEKKAADDIAQSIALAKKVEPLLTLYSVSASLKLSVYDRAYLRKYVSALKENSKVTCVGYIYSKGTSYATAKERASRQSKAVCAIIKSQKKSIQISTVLYPAAKAPKAAAGAKWVAVSFRIDSFRK